MEPNNKGNVAGKAEMAFLDDDDFFKEWEKLESSTAGRSPPHQLHPANDLPSSIPYNHHQDPSSHYRQSQYPPAHSTYYPHQNYQNYSNPQDPQPHIVPQQNYPTHPSYSNQQIRPNPVSYQNHLPHPYPCSQPPPHAYQHRRYVQSSAHQPVAYPHDYHTPTPTFGDESSPMQRMQQLAAAQHGGPLAQSAAAAAAAEAQAARRISPTGRGGRREGGGAEETVRDVLHRQYIEQRRQQEMSVQMQHMQPQPPYQSGLLPNPYPQSSLIPPDQSSTPTSILGASPASSAPRLDSPPAPPTPIFTFPLVTSSSTPPPPPSVVSLPQPSSISPDKDASPPSDASPVRQPVEPLGTLDTDAQKAALIQRLKTAHVMSALQKANTAAMATDVSVERLSGAALHQAATVVRNLEAKAPPSSSRKRHLDETSAPPEAEASDPPLVPGPRFEINEKGEREKKVYMLVRYCNQNDPEYNPTGVLKTMDQIEKEKERNDMISFSYTSHIMPYEMVDFRIKKPEGYVEMEPAAKAACAAAMNPALTKPQ